MKDRIEYFETPEFQKDFKRLLRKFKTLEEDFVLAKKAAIELYHVQQIDNLSIFTIPGFSSGPIKIMKLKKFACKSLAGRGAKSGIRVIYAFDPTSFRVDLIEMYYKSESENEDRDRIKAYLKSMIRS